MGRFKLVFFAPSTYTARILDHLFKKHPQHLGKIGDYEQCAFITPGAGGSLGFLLFLYGTALTARSPCPCAGQFKPGPNATPTVGSTGILEKVEEHRVEILVLDNGDKTHLNDAINTLKEACLSRSPYSHSCCLTHAVRYTRTKKSRTMSTDSRISNNFRPRSAFLVHPTTTSPISHRPAATAFKRSQVTQSQFRVQFITQMTAFSDIPQSYFIFPVYTAQ
ncbi:hypothetical protein JVU11DRAFT_7637 [Chiua virens]|nr:hypothetical protein JVU11DRAFT_7637 [Chiua virens]